MGTTYDMSNTEGMCFYDDYNLIYEERVYPDYILFHNMNGVLATAGTLWMASIIRQGLIEGGYRVELWTPPEGDLE